MSHLKKITNAPDAAFDSPIDEALVPLASLIEGLAAVGGQQRDEQLGVSMSIESMKLDLPVELDILTDDNGQVIIGGAPPTQYTETTIMPVFHQLKMTVVNDAKPISQKLLPGVQGDGFLEKSPPGRRRQKR